MIEIKKEVEEKAKNTELILNKALKYTIANEHHYLDACDELKAIKSYGKELDDTRKTMTRPLDETKKQIMTFFKQPLDFLKQAESAIKKSMLNYQHEQEAIRLEQERKLREEARKREEAEREKLRLQAEKERLKREEAERKLMESANKLEQERLAAEIEEARETEEELISNSEHVVEFVPTIEKKEIKTAGISTRKNWKFRISEEALLPREYLIVNEKALQSVATATKGSLKIPGVEFYCEETIAARNTR